uniref:hypothetical protein n=1 Tax=Hydrotalea sp. TaxID=2881279 RepID=UPI002616120E
VIAQQQSLIFYNQKSFNIHFEIDNQTFSFGNSFYVNIVPQNPNQPYLLELFKMTINSAGFSISQIGGQKIYTLKKVLYDNITGVDNPQIAGIPYAYNIEQLTPRRMLDAHADFIRSVFFNMAGDTLYFQTSDKNKTLSTTLNGVTISEKSDVPIGSLNSNLLFYPFYFNIKTEVPINFQQILNNAANGHVSFTRNGKTFYGFPMTVKQKPALNEVQEWKLLCSPATNIDDLINLEYTGIDNIQLMNYGTAISYLNPVKFVPLGYNQPAQYNFIHMDNDWFINRVNFWPFKENYFQKWQTNDIIKLQCITNGLAPVIVQVYNDSGKVVYTFSLTQVNDPAIVAPLILWQGSLSLSSLNAFIADTIAGGYFYLVLTAGTGATTTSFISEGLWIRQKHDNTILFEYTHDRNTQATVFTSGFTPSFRVEGWLDEFDSESHFTTFEDQPADMVIINGIPYDLFTLNIADGLGIPDYVRKLLERIMLLSNVAIDGKLFSRNGDAKFEKKDIPGWPMSGWKLKIRSKVNSDAITLTTTGDLDANLTIEYQINTKNFGNGAGQDNIVQVEKINN